ncbi:MAG: helix-turn-helix transcriptional regulator [Sediminibacterium sp.]
MQIITSMLTEKQLIVFECLLKGYTYKEISQQLGISFYAVNQRAKTVYKKAGVNSRIELMNLMVH